MNKGDKTDCQLPRKWSGIWFLSGHPERIQINSRNLGWLGRCHQVHDDNKYVFYRAADNCFQCVAFWSRHENVLEFKSGECSVNDDPEHLCDISPDKTLNTLIRVDGDNIACPIPVPSMFSYDKGRVPINIQFRKPWIYFIVLLLFVNPISPLLSEHLTYGFFNWFCIY